MEIKNLDAESAGELCAMREDEEWAEVLIIGSGAGGATLATALAPTGARILILERGDWLRREKANWDRRAVHLERRYWPREVWYDEHGVAYPCPTHYCVGGNTKFYGAALLRFRREDFGPLQHSGGLSPGWPISYEDLEPYYTTAEQQYAVHGMRGADPTEPTASGDYPSPSLEHEPRIEQLACDLATAGLHPFPLPLGVLRDDRAPERDACIRCDTCGGYPCLVGGKADAETMAIRRALIWPNVRLLTGTRALRLEVGPGGRTVRAVLAERDGQVVRYRAEVVVLAAGAVQSAALLLASASERHPHGLANEEGLVGRYYMRHLKSSLIAVARVPHDTVFAKTLGLNDFYLGAPDWPYPLGHVQTLHRSSAELLAAANCAPWPGLSLEETAARTLDLCIFSEDLPDPENCVSLDSEGHIVVRYYPNNQEGHRRLLAKLDALLPALGCVGRLESHSVYVGASTGPANANHQCGTLRMGYSQRDGVVDRNCRSWSVDNLYVADASVFPSSSATNPALTIMANALRVADVIRNRFDLGLS